MFSVCLLYFFFCSYFGLSDIAGYIGYMYFSKAKIEFGSSMADIYVNDIIVVCMCVCVCGGGGGGGYGFMDNRYSWN